MVLGIELGSTRIKGVTIDDMFRVRQTGVHDWENRLEDGYWTYGLDEIQAGLRDVVSQIDTNNITALGISAMMHGYLCFDKDGNLLTPFRTWRNTTTETAAAKLTGLFSFNIPQRWSVAHLYQAVINNEPHVKNIAFITTLAGYVHWKLTGKKVLGVGDASGMFPVESNIYNEIYMRDFKELTGIDWASVAPEILSAGENAGTLTEAGAEYLGLPKSLAGIPLCPPEGDAGTGMVATNSITPRTGNVSAGTSVFAMLVLENALSKLYPEIDMVTTPAGKPVAMVHCNNCTSDFDAWVGLLGQAMTLMGVPPKKPVLYDTLYQAALSGDPDGGGLVSVNYLSGEHITGFREGRPLFARTPDSSFTLENFMRVLLLSSMATLKTGMDILTGGEGVSITKLLGHGGLFKTPVAGQKLMAGALNIPVAVMDSAGEGGAWGIALLAAYAVCKDGDESLERFLADKVFSDSAVSVINPDPADAEGFKTYMARYNAALSVERAAVAELKNRGT